MRGNFAANVNASLITETGHACPYNTSLFSNTTTTSLAVFKGKLFLANDFNSTTGMYYRVYDTWNDRAVCYISPNNRASTTNYHQKAVYNPFAENKVMLLSNWAVNLFYYRCALTHYKVPAGSPVRPPDSGVKITYQLDMLY